MTERTRFTISVEDYVYEAFADLAHSSGVSLSRCIGDWLRDTSEAAQMTTIRVNAVRKSPEEAMRAYMHAQTEEIIERMPESLAELEKTAWPDGLRAKLGLPVPGPSRPTGGHGAAVMTKGKRHSRGGQASGAAARQSAPAKPVPPSSNTGGKSPGKTRGAP